MNYEDLRRFQRMERNSSKLGELPRSFYDELCQLLLSQKAKCKEGQAEETKVFENMVKTARDVFDRREQKILTKAMRFARTNETEKDVITDEEKSLFEKLSEDLKKSRQDFEMLLIGNGKARNLEKIQNINDIPTINNGQTGEDLNIVMVRILKKVPKFVSGDLKEYGPFEANSIVKLPRKEADLLSNRSFIELV
jgi:DNA replication initiation complex subunit (GINS family)